MVAMEAETLKVELEAETCCVCGAGGEDLLLPEEHDAAAPPHSVPLRAVLMHLNNTKTVPTGRLCQSCINKALNAYSFSTQLSAKGPPPLSEKIRALRKRLHELTQKIDVFIVVGSGANGAYSEEDIIMVERGAPASPAALRARTLRGDRAYQCTVCPDTFPDAGSLSAHAAAHPADARHSCWTCGAQFSSGGAAAAHALTHGTARAAACQVCGHAAPSAAALRRHEAACEARCPACAAVCASRAALRAHVATHGTVCTACFARFPSPAARRAHQLAHALDRQFVCGYDGCILRFATRSNLLAHIRKCHAGTLEAPPSPPPPARCHHCERTFATAAALKRHARVHRSAEEEGREEYLELETLEDMDDQTDD